MTLTQKETTLLQDLKSQEQLCVEKCTRYSADACDQQLKNLFSLMGRTEQQHLDTLNQIANGTVPQMNGSTTTQQQTTFSVAATSNGTDKQKDKYFCSDILSTEKHVSSLYDTCIFEFKDSGIRNALNHIQKDEQIHGEQVYNYMSQNSMYS